MACGASARGQIELCVAVNDPYGLHRADRVDSGSVVTFFFGGGIFGTELEVATGGPRVLRGRAEGGRAGYGWHSRDPWVHQIRRPSHGLRNGHGISLCHHCTQRCELQGYVRQDEHRFDARSNWFGGAGDRVRPFIEAEHTAAWRGGPRLIGSCSDSVLSGRTGERSDGVCHGDCN